MGYQWLNGYKTKLSDRLDKTSGILPIEDAQGLAAKLGAGHTYLTITDGLDTEIVKASTFGSEVKIERSQGGTDAKTFANGSCVKWEATKMGIEETICSADFVCQEKVKNIEPCGC